MERLKLENDSLQQRVAGLESQLLDTQQQLENSVLDLQTKVSFLFVTSAEGDTFAVSGPAVWNSLSTAV